MVDGRGSRTDAKLSLQNQDLKHALHLLCDEYEGKKGREKKKERNKSQKVRQTKDNGLDDKERGEAQRNHVPSGVPAAIAC